VAIRPESDTTTAKSISVPPGCVREMVPVQSLREVRL
jgi:hypothetical protein